MALRRPPQHRVDAEIVYVHSSDSAWNPEAQELLKKCEDLAHPVVAYAIGRTRFDLHAKLKHKDGVASAADWLDLPNATRFVLRRLTTRQLSRVDARIHSPDEATKREAKIDACRYALVSMEGPDALKLSGDELSDSDLQRLEDTFGLAMVWRIGDTAYHASLPLSDDEKKAFAS